LLKDVDACTHRDGLRRCRGSQVVNLQAQHVDGLRADGHGARAVRGSDAATDE